MTLGRLFVNTHQAVQFCTGFKGDINRKSCNAVAPQPELSDSPITGMGPMERKWAIRESWTPVKGPYPTPEHEIFPDLHDS